MPGEASVFLVPYSHLDLFWLGDREECLSRGNRIIARALALADRDPDFRFLVESAAFLRHFLASHPERAEDLRRHVVAGRIEPSPSWATIMPGAAAEEALVRNLLLAVRWLEAHAGRASTVAHPGDVPGFPPQYPQLLARAGVRAAVVTRMFPVAAPLLRWRSPDGSEIAVWNAYQRYDWAARHGLHGGAAAAIRSGIEDELRQAAVRSGGPVLLHWGSDLTLPHPDPSSIVREWNHRSSLTMRLASAEEFFASARMRAAPVLSGEVPNGWAVGASDCVYPHVSWLDVPAVHALATAEIWAALAHAMKLVAYPHELLRAAWELLLESMDHNWDGTGAAAGDRRHEEYRRFALFVGQETGRRATRAIAERVSAGAGDGHVAVVVFNPLSWNRDAPAEAHAVFHGDPFAVAPPGVRPPLRLLDERGRDVPFQIVEDHWLAAREVRLAFVARDLPPIGYRSYLLRPGAAAPEQESPFRLTDDGDGLTVESDRLRLRMNRVSGAFALWSREAGDWVLRRSVIEAAGTAAEGRGAFEHRPTGETFRFEPEAVSLLERGPVRAVVVVSGRVLDVVVEQRLVLWAGIDWLDVEESLTFAGPRPVRLQQIFETPYREGTVEYGLAFGVGALDHVLPGAGPQQLHDDETNPECWATFREAQGWIDISNAAGGLTIATDHRPFECAPPSLRADLAFVHLTPGRSTWRFRLRPHASGWRDSRSDRAGWELNRPVAAVSINDPESEKPLPPSMSLASLGETVVTALKLSEDGSRLVVRAFDPLGRAGAAPLRLFRSPRAVARADLLERDQAPENPDAIRYRPYEVVTLSVQL